jgi:hypothetical protein
MWLFSALESRGLSSSKLQSNSEETDMTAPQLSNSPQYYNSHQYKIMGREGGPPGREMLTFGALNTVTKTLSLKNSYPSSTTM